MMAIWECFVCWKVNEDDDAAKDENCVCRCCGRPRNFVPKSLINSKAKPLVLHGLTAAQHKLHPTLVQALQEAGLDLVATDSAGWTALQCAAMLGDAIAVQTLLHSKTQKSSNFIEASRSGGWRALHLATRGGHLAVVEELLLSNADVNARLEDSDGGLTPLHIAVKHGYANILDLLLQCGADPSLVTRQLNQSPLHIAVSAGHEKCVRLLLSYPNIFAIRDNDGLTALQLANLLPITNESQREIIILLEAHQPFGAPPSIQMRSLLG